MFRKLRKIIENFIETMSKQNISAFAASTAFFYFLSMVPIMIILFVIIPYTPLTRMDILAVLGKILPGNLDGIVVYLLDSAYEKSNGVLPVAVIVTLWSAGSGTLALKRGLNAIFEIEEKWNYFIVRLFSSLYTLIMVVVSLFLMLILVFEKQMVSLVLGFYEKLNVVLELILPFRYLLLWVVLLLFITVIFTFLPSKRQRFMEQLPGAAFTALAWSLFSYGFSGYVSVADYSIYGSLAVVIILLIWLYMCMYIMFIGAYINFYFKSANRAFIRSRYDRRTKEKEQN